MFPTHRIAALLVLFATACDSPTGEQPPPPRGELPKISVGATVEGTVEPGKVVEYELTVPASDFRVLFLARSGNPADTLGAAVVNDAGAFVATVVSVGTDSLPATHTSGWLRPPVEGRWTIGVGGRSPAARGPFTLRLFPSDPAPESRPAAISVGETVEGEALDVPDDVDEFFVEGVQGEEWIVFAQAPGPVGRRVDVELVERATSLSMGRVSVTGGAEALEEQSSGRLVLPRGGSYLVRVSAGTFPPQPGGPYRFLVQRVDRAPEVGSAVLRLGDVAEERIGSVGDVDEFTFTAPAAQEANLFVQLVEGMDAGLTVVLLRGGTELTRVHTTTPASSLDELASGRLVLDEEGSYTVRVYGPEAGRPGSATGSYRFELNPVDRLPEGPGELRLQGPPVHGRVDRGGDVDEFEFTGREAELVVLRASGPAPARGELLAELLRADGTSLSEAVVDGRGTVHARRAYLPATETYRVRIAGLGNGSPASGDYSVAVDSMARAPEQGPSRIAIGDTVSGRIDHPGDLDVYTFEGQAGKEVIVYLGSTSLVGQIGLTVDAWPSFPPHTYAGAPSLDGRSTGRFTLRDTVYEIVVDPQLFGTSGAEVAGDYTFRVFPLDRRPETVPATYVLGDTIREPLYPSGDIDEYLFEVAATTTLGIWWEGPGGSPLLAVIGYLSREGSSEVIWTSADDDGRRRRITLQPGAYRLSVRNPNLDAPSAGASQGIARLDYGFAFVP